MLLAYLKTSPQSPGSHIEDLNEFYRRARDRFDSDADFADESRQTVVRLQSGQAEECALWTRIVDESRRHFQPIYQRMNITLRPEHERGESFYNPMLADTVRELRDKGVAVESEGAIVVFVKGFEAPLIIQKRDGGFGYGTTDLAAIRYRARELHAQRIVYVTDARQIQHFAQVFDAARRAGWVEGVELDHVTFGTIFGVDGKPIKTREGDPPLLRNVLDEAEQRAFAIVTAKNPELAESQRRAVAHAVGIGAIKYFDLNKDRNSDYVFDWEQMLALEGNTAPYMQYAYARIRSIFRKAGVAESEVRGSVLLESPFELALARHLLRIEEIVELIARELRPHYLCNYLYELATKFSAFYENCPVLQSEQPTRSSRLALCDLTARTMALGLDLLGIEHPERM
jgi:arginyl-tRNA synthetase